MRIPRVAQHCPLSNSREKRDVDRADLCSAKTHKSACRSLQERLLASGSPLLALHGLTGLVLHRGSGLTGANDQAPLPAHGFPAGPRCPSICSQGTCQPGPAAHSGHICCGGAVPFTVLALWQCLQAVWLLQAEPGISALHMKAGAQQSCMGMARYALC